MLLATCNSQGELDPLEIGIHALKAVPLEKGGRGKKGGLSEYAEKLGRTKRAIIDLRLGAEVLIKSGKLTSQFLGKATHLAAIHDLPPDLWPGAVASIGKMSVAEVEAAAICYRRCPNWQYCQLF